MDVDRVSRRRILLAGGGLVGSLAGCLEGLGPGGTGTEEDDGTTDVTPTPDETATPGDTVTPGDTATPGETETPGETATPDETPTPGGSIDDLELQGELVADGFASPIAVVPTPDGDFLVADQMGTIYRADGTDGTTEQFLDVTDRMVSVDGYSEQGLLGLALHPDFESNGRCFVRYSAPSSTGSHTFVLSEFAVDASGVADPGSEQVLLEIPQPQANHNAGAITFGPDGYLYVGVGDGGGAGDQGSGHVSDWYDAVDGGNGQDVTENLLGSVLRIDVDGETSDRPYAIPGDNPLVGQEGLDEHYAWGFRNPWRLSFGPDGRLFVADVGQSDYEEVDVVEKGGNYGWNVREGDSCYDSESCPSETPDGEPLLDPIVSYPRSGAEVSGVSVIGGYLYDGSAIPTLAGTYVFGDWQAQGELFVAEESSDGSWSAQAVPVSSVGESLLSFGRDDDGELLVCTTDSNSNGTVHRLVRA